jgi:hypothetical protein
MRCLPMIFIQAYSYQTENAAPEDGDTAASNDHDAPVNDGQDDSDTRIVNGDTLSLSKLQPGDN